MIDIDFITPRLATGGELWRDREARLMAELGITHIIDGRAEAADADLYASPRLRRPALIKGYLWLPADDDFRPRPASWFKLAAGFALGAWEDDPEAKVLAHCAAGINRGPSLAFGILLALGYTPDRAWDMIRAARPKARIAYAADAVRALAPGSKWMPPVIREPRGRLLWTAEDEYEYDDDDAASAA